MILSLFIGAPAGTTILGILASYNDMFAVLAACGAFDLQSVPAVAVFGLAAVARSILAASHFGRFHGGHEPTTRRSDVAAVC